MTEKKPTILAIPGLIRGESNKDYHDNSAVSNSGLKDFQKRPSLFYKKHVIKSIKQEECEAFVTGTAAHTLILEGDDVFESRYSVLPYDFDGRRNDGKGLLAKLEANGIIPIKHALYRELVEYRESVIANPQARALLAQGEPELTWRLHGTCYDTQCRSDWFCASAPAFGGMEGMPEEGMPYIADFKTTQTLEDWVSDGWNNPIFKFGYDSQCVFYMAVVNRILKAAGHPVVDKFYFIVTEKQEPRETAVFVIDTATLDTAYGRLMDTLGKLNECYRTGTWPGFRSDVIVTGISDRVRDSRTLEASNAVLMLDEPSVRLAEGNRLVTKGD